MELLTTKIIAMVGMALLALFFGLLPLKAKQLILKGEEHSKQRRKRERIISGLLCFGAGVLIATVFMHMLPETRAGFAKASKDGLLGGHKHDVSHVHHKEKLKKEGKNINFSDNHEDHEHDHHHNIQNSYGDHEQEHDHHHNNEFNHSVHEHDDHHNNETNHSDHEHGHHHHKNESKHGDHEHDHHHKNESKHGDHEHDHHHKNETSHSDHEHDHHHKNESNHGDHEHDHHHNIESNHGDHEHESQHVNLEKKSLNNDHNHNDHHDHEHPIIDNHHELHDHDDHNHDHYHEEKEHLTTINSEFDEMLDQLSTKENVAATNLGEVVDTTELTISSTPLDRSEINVDTLHIHHRIHESTDDRSDQISKIQNVKPTTLKLDPISAPLTHNHNDHHHHNNHSGHDDHSEEENHSYPYAELSICVGFFFIYLIEEVVHKIFFRNSGNSYEESGINQQNGHSHIPNSKINNNKVGIECSPVTADAYPMEINQTFSKGMSPRAAEWSSGGIDNPVFAGDIDATGWNPRIKNTLLTNSKTLPITDDAAPVPNGAAISEQSMIEIEPTKTNVAVTKQNYSKSVLATVQNMLIVLAIGFHAIFEGMAIGLQGEQTDVWYLSFAISAHKFVIMFCVGLELLKDDTSKMQMIFSTVVLALITPIGIAIGIIVTENSDFAGSEHLLVVSILQGLAGGTLLYVAFLEILERERSKSGGQFTKFICLIIGFCFMCSLELIGGHSH